MSIGDSATQTQIRLLSIHCPNATVCIVIIFGGGMSMAGDELLDNVRVHIKRRTWSILPTGTYMIYTGVCYLLIRCVMIVFVT